MTRVSWHRAAVCAAIVGACGQRPDTQSTAAGEGSPGDSVALARRGSLARRCAAPFDAAAPPLQAAARCAEEFVARNGYTDLPPAADTSAWTRESFELPWGSVAELMRHRRNTLERRAAAVCPGYGPEGTGFTVVFRYRLEKGADPASGRAVRVGADYGGLIMAHQDVNLQSATSPGSPCTVLVGVGGR